MIPLERPQTVEQMERMNDDLGCVEARSGVRAYAVDQGYLTQHQLHPWQELLKKRVGQEPDLGNGVKVRFGDRMKECRKVKYTLTAL